MMNRDMDLPIPQIETKKIGIMDTIGEAKSPVILFLTSRRTDKGRLVVEKEIIPPKGILLKTYCIKGELKMFIGIKARLAWIIRPKLGHPSKDRGADATKEEIAQGKTLPLKKFDAT